MGFVLLRYMTFFDIPDKKEVLIQSSFQSLKLGKNIGSKIKIHQA